MALEVEASDRLLRIEITLSIHERHDDHFTKLWLVGRQVVSSKNLEVFVDMGKLLQIVDIVFVGFNVKPEIHSGELVQLPHVNIVAEVVAAKVSVFLAMLLDSLQQLFELLLSLKYIDFFRLDFFSLGFLKVLVQPLFPQGG